MPMPATNVVVDRSRVWSGRLCRPRGESSRKVGQSCGIEGQLVDLVRMTADDSAEVAASHGLILDLPRRRVAVRSG